MGLASSHLRYPSNYLETLPMLRPLTLLRATAGLAFVFGASFSVAAFQQATGSSSSKSKPNYSHANDFVVRGTVFNEKALSVPGAQLRIRRANDKKFRWETRTNSRGEFAVRVPQGSDYEIVAHVKGYIDQTR